MPGERRTRSPRWSFGLIPHRRCPSAASRFTRQVERNDVIDSSRASSTGVAVPARSTAIRAEAPTEPRRKRISTARVGRRGAVSAAERTRREGVGAPKGRGSVGAETLAGRPTRVMVTEREARERPAARRPQSRDRRRSPRRPACVDHPPPAPLAADCGAPSDGHGAPTFRAWEAPKSRKRGEKWSRGPA